MLRQAEAKLADHCIRYFPENSAFKCARAFARATSINVQKFRAQPLRWVSSATDGKFGAAIRAADEGAPRAWSLPFFRTWKVPQGFLRSINKAAAQKPSADTLLAEAIENPRYTLRSESLVN